MQIQEINKKIAPYKAGEAKVFFSTIYYHPVQPIFSEKREVSQNTQVVLFSGLANSLQLEEYVRSNFQLYKSFSFPDHHHYLINDIEKIKKAFNNIENPDKILLTTEKDRVKITDDTLKPLLEGLPVYELPIKVHFINDQDSFDQWIIETLRKFSDH